MKSREFGTWPPRNALGADRQHLYDEYNRAFKKERPPQPKEYASSDIEEYYRVPEMKDVSGNPYEQNREALSKRSDRDKNANAAKRNLALRQVVGLLVGSVIVVTTYQTMAAQRQTPPEQPAIVETDAPSDTPSGPSGAPSDPTVMPTEPTELTEAASALLPSWTWSEDRQTVVVELFDADGNLIETLPAEVSISEEAATCNREGLRTYTATVESEDSTYTDTQTEAIPPLGHAFDNGRATILENGQTAMVFTCTRCHEQFTIATSFTEND